jgi:hypothetical protein
LTRVSRRSHVATGARGSPMTPPTRAARGPPDPSSANRPNPSVARQAWTAALLSTTSTRSVPFARPSDGSHDVGHRLAGGGLAPPRWQGRAIGRNESLEVGWVDQVLRPDPSGEKAARANPPANGLGIAADSAGGIGDCQHVCSITTTSILSVVRPTRAASGSLPAP